MSHQHTQPLDELLLVDRKGHALLAMVSSGRAHFEDGAIAWIEIDHASTWDAMAGRWVRNSACTRIEAPPRHGRHPSAYEDALWTVLSQAVLRQYHGAIAETEPRSLNKDVAPIRINARVG